MATQLTTHTLGYPRIGAHRELKKATEAYWRGALPEDGLHAAAREIRAQNWRAQKTAGLTHIPSNDFSFYDQMLDLSCLLGNVPARFGWKGGEVPLDLRFAMARGRSGETHGACGCAPAFACEMTKWFDTNYHYIVPEFTAQTRFQLSDRKPFDEFAEALALDLLTRPVLIGPLTYLYLGKMEAGGPDRLRLLPRLLPVYAEILARLQGLGAEWVQLDEPILALDLPDDWRAAFAPAYTALREAAPDLNLLAATYFGPLLENLPTALALPVQTLHLDLTRSDADLAPALEQAPSSLNLSLGVVDGRNIWRNEYARSLPQIEKAVAARGAGRVWVAPSCSLLHVPVSLSHEKQLARELRSWMAFAEEKLVEVDELARLAGGEDLPDARAWNRGYARKRRESSLIHRPEVKARCAAILPRDAERDLPFARRRELQQAALGLPAYPTTTIGSFPQTADVRTARAAWKRGALDDALYQAQLEEATRQCVRLQEELGLDVLVHGEFERNDMVEYFGEQLAGFAFTQNGWVQSYGSRCVKPPIIFGDVSRPTPMTVKWAKFAQGLTDRPMKGMLTGPITILQWSFVRDDQPRRETARQIALAIRDEVAELDLAGIRVIQIDEPALREGLPLRRADAPAYLAWSTEAFRLAAAVARDATQIHTHMCYCEFNDVIEAIAALDADVISIETSRSQMELLEAFVQFRYPNEVGPGVWDIHSPRVPSTAEMVDLLEKAAQVLPPEHLWVNPDCGLKTRAWPEVKAALANLVDAARIMRKRGD